jgi:hypothetical protein
LLSSAILYVAIVAIWAGVLIPRWLRRDSAASERDSEDLITAEAEPEVAEETAPPPRRRRDGAAGFEERSARHAEPVAPIVSRAPARPEPRPQVQPEARAEARDEARAEVPRTGVPRDQEHKKVQSARRRLLYMLLVLAIGSGALAFTGMAAWWVIVPPAIMLAGYLALLREAAKADAERSELARTRATAAVAAAKRTTPPAPPAPAPDAEVIDISASLTQADKEFYDQYADAKLRAVGDLAGRLTG